jgi:hypothetical protein
MKFVLYTLVGSVFILVAIIGLYTTDVRDFVDVATVDDRAAERLKENPHLSRDDAREYHTFSIPVLQRAGQAAMLRLNGHTNQLGPRPEIHLGEPERRTEGADGPIELLGRGVKPHEAVNRMDQPFFRPTYQYVLFALLFVGFAVKVPIVPLHSWLPDAHVEAPTPISMVLAGVLLLLGDVVLGGALISLTEFEHPSYFFTLPLTRRQHLQALVVAQRLDRHSGERRDLPDAIRVHIRAPETWLGELSLYTVSRRRNWFQTNTPNRVIAAKSHVQNSPTR